jgi:RIO-like serine/threonine protein kinase
MLATKHRRGTREQRDMFLDNQPSEGSDVNGDSHNEPFVLSKPRLVNHKTRTQVFSCDYAGAERITPCIVKLFSPRSKANYEKEVAAYTSAASHQQSSLPIKLWSGVWSVARYQQFIGNKFPSVLRRTENQLNVILLSYVESIDALSPDESPEIRQRAVKAALRALQVLHSIGIVHGDVSRDNVLLHQNGAHWEATWIDFASSIVDPSKRDVTHEWQKAIEYFSNLVCAYWSNR